MTDLASAPGGDYNLVPYISKPFPQSQPPRLAALAAMFGLDAPDISGCSMLELGCASGGNIIPLALRFPGGRFHGVDLTPRHVSDGQARVRELGLENIRIEQGDIAALDLGDERFDYIVCHGVYSWVPPHVRDAILRICGDHLSANGVAYVSYNVYPGWHMRGVIRDMMIYHAGAAGDPGMRIAKARWVLDNIAKFSREGVPYGEMLRSEVKGLAGMDDAYILGEFLADENAPCYFRDFADKAAARGLVYLCETEIQQCIPEYIGAETGALIRTMSRDNLIPLEQYMDFFKGRTFRQTLLVKAERATEIQRKLMPEGVRDLHVSARMTVTFEADGSFVFKDAVGRALTTRLPGVRDALQGLSEAFPATRTVAEMVAEANAPDLEVAILDAVFKGVLIGMIEVSSVPWRPGKATSDRPKAWPLSLLEGREGSKWTTSPSHNAVQLDLVCSTLLPYLDGTHDRDALRGKLLAAVQEGRIWLKDNATGEKLTGEQLEVAAGNHVGFALDKLAANGILE